MSGSQSAPPDLPGFTYQRAIGGGGFADVFLYAQSRPSRNVAVKVLRRKYVTEVGRRRFEAEGDLMAEVSAHPNIVTIFTTDTAPDGRPYLVMEYYPGQHFGLRCKGGKLPVSEVLHVGIQVCSAVETAHRAGILHRDIKPANVLTSAYGRPGLTDFGISVVQRGGTVERAAGISLGYTAPEVVEDRDAGSVASDVYSLGATIYSLVAGNSPFHVTGGENSDSAVTARALAGKAPELTREDAPNTLRSLIRQAMALDPRQRPGSALHMAMALQEIEQQLALPTTPLDVQRDDPDPRGGGEPSNPVAGDHDEGTRYGGARVVVAQPQPAPPAPSRPARWVEPAALIQGPPPGSGTGIAAPASPVAPGAPRAWTAPPSGANRRDDGQVWNTSDTVLRGVPGGHVSPEPAAPAGPNRAKLVMLASGAALVIALVVIVALTLGSGSKHATAGSGTGGQAVAPPNQAAVISPDPPTGIQATVDPTGLLTITWTVDDAQAGDSYRVQRSDSGHVGEVVATVTTTRATAQVSAGSTPCVTVVALRAGVQSIPVPPDVCAAHVAVAPAASQSPTP